MFNLIRKDIFLQTKTLMILLPVLCVYVALGGSSSHIWSGFLFSITMVMTIFSMDEKPSINTLLNALPYTRREIVSSKYIGTLIVTSIVVLTIFIGNLIIHRELIVWKDIMFIVSLVMISTSFMFPFSYQFKTKYLFRGLLVLGAIFLVLINTLVPNFLDIIRGSFRMLLSIQNINVYLLIIFSIISLYVCSWMLSMHIYKNKAF